MIVDGDGQSYRLQACAVASLETRPSVSRGVRRLPDEDPLPKRSLTALASIAGVSRFTFAHAFARAYGISPHA